MSFPFLRPVALAFLALLAGCAPWEHPASARRGLLASPVFAGQPMKAVYFFPGQRGKNTGLYTTHPTDPRDWHWNSDPSARAWVMDRMVAAHANTVVMSYWGDMTEDSPMALDAVSLPALLDAAADKPLVVLPAIESGDGWSFADEFPTDASGLPAPGLVARIGAMVGLFRGRMQEWAQMYDREGEPRYAVNVILARSNRLPAPSPAASEAFAQGFEAVAQEVERLYGVRVGFTIDPVRGDGYSATPEADGFALGATDAVLAIQAFEPEISSGVIENGPPCPTGKGCAPRDNDVDNLERIVSWKAEDTQAWAKAGLPAMLSVSNGYDGRYVWAKPGAGYWGDNHDATDDRFRNWLSEMKGQGAVGLTFDAWNGYTEGYAATVSKEHGTTVYDWLSDFMRPDPRKCDHTHYERGARTYRVYGSICSKWVRFGGDRRLGAPVSSEVSSALGRVSHFAYGDIYWSRQTHAHVVHGSIGEAYKQAGGDASCLGLPVEDERPAPAGGRVSRFEHGVITWTGGPRGQVVCEG